MSEPTVTTGTPTTPATPRAIALHDLHLQWGAKMGPFAGFLMPIQYGEGLKAEHLHTRAHAGLFDVSHMGQLRITGPDLHRSLERALPIDFDGWPLGLQRYSVLLNDAGGIIDDLMITRLADEVRIVVNAGNRDKDLERLRALCPGLSIKWVDAALIALQGPEAQAVLAELDADAASMSFMQTRTLTLLGAACLTSRSGYTGEDGYEISIALQQAQAIARRLASDPRVKPVGLGARDTLRLEAGLPLHGSDIDETTTPVQAGLHFAIAPSRRAGGAKAGGFPGAPLILEEWAHGAPRRLVGLISEEAIPIRAHSAILDAQTGLTVGEVTSGTVSPTLGRPVMLAYVAREVLATRSGSVPSLCAAVRDKRPAVRQVPLPFVPKRYKR
jgi:aminomethyltransferase